MIIRTPIKNIFFMLASMVLASISTIVIDQNIKLMAFASTQAKLAVALLVSYFFANIFRLSGPFLFFCLAFPIILFLANDQQQTILSSNYSWFWIIGFLALSGLHLPAIWSHIPYYPTPVNVYENISKNIPTNANNFIDIGCGTAKLLIYLKDHHPNLNIYGCEISFLPYLLAKVKSIFYKNITISFKSFWKLNWKDFDCIYCFLSPAPMDKVGEKFSKEGKKDAILISNSFCLVQVFSEIKLIQTIDINNSRIKGGTLYIYQKC